MLNEIIRNVGYENIIKTIKESVKITNSIYVRLPINGGINEENFLIIKKEAEISQLESIQWFKDREFYSNRITPNKSVIKGGLYSMFVYSCNPNAITFDWDKFKEHKNTSKEDLKQSFKNMVEEFLTKIGLIANLGIFFNNFDNILKFISKTDLPKFHLKLFLDLPTEDYKNEYLKYIANMLFDKGTQVNISDKDKGRVSLFYTLNTADKPFLAHMLSNTDEIHLLDVEESEKILNLKKYMDLKKREELESNISITKYKMELDRATKKWYLDDFNVNPTQLRDDIVNFNITNALEDKCFNEASIGKYSDLTNYILRLLLESKVRSYYSEKDKTETKFKTFSSLYYEYINDINNTNIDVFKNIYPNMIKNIYGLYKNDESIYGMINIINFDISMRDYLYKTNIKEGFRKMLKNIKSKILSDELYIIESEAEFFTVCGQLAKFLKIQTQTDEKTNSLFSEYLTATNVKRLMTVLSRDKNRLDYDSNIYGRSNKIMYAILEYYSVNRGDLRKIDTLEFNKGLYYGDCLLYSKKDKEIIDKKEKAHGTDNKEEEK
ncbi:hypothetical protein KPL35_11710 [Clostridium sp. CF011]|uniref:hypothetical protein n=1 Tax=Clostridium sp. CF011 TaxID=2843318 RepID=UPI001C0C6EAD|nr:hypothetical protein [Clostridium sp. CF011]MBU3092741.1 hypothetical protein [Clostridium sp. CF011]WAG71162.1 hypothetical protein LL036_07020 [Clostridium sp. CF011]